MAQMLRHVKTGEVWPFNPDMARHPDVEIFNQVDPQFAEALRGNADATLGDVLKGTDKPVVDEAHEFEDVPDFVPPVVTAKAPTAKQKAAAAKKKKAAAAAAKKKAEEEAAAAAAAAEEDTDEDLDEDLDTDEDSDFEDDFGDLDEDDE